MSQYHSIFAERLASYVELRRQFGLRFTTQEGTLRAFDRHVHERGYQGTLTEELACEFATAVPDTSITAPGRRYLVVRQFAEYLATFDPRTPRLDLKAICRAERQPPPYIFTQEEIARLLRRSTEFWCRHPVSNQALHAMIGLAACTGLRGREIVNLDLSDVDLQTGLLTVQRSKFDKDRLVPVHPTTTDVLCVYLAVRDQIAGSADETAFFLNARGQRFKPDNVHHLFGQLVRRVEPHHPRGRPPTFSSLRHTFAVRRLVTWYQAGQDVQALLPALATYMGHVHYTSTSYYLTATAELLGLAADRLSAASEVLHGQNK